MSEPDPSSNTPPPHPEQAAATTTVRLPDFYFDLPQAWFYCIDAMFTAAKITSSLTKFHWVLSKLPFSLIDTIRPLAKHPSFYRDPYQELQDILLRSYGLSVPQMTSTLCVATPGPPSCGITSPPCSRPQ